MRADAARLVLVFDSGLGGLTVLREIARARADVELSLVADDAGFPYGRLDDAALLERVVTVLDRSIDALRPDLVVIACNTASTLALPVLRKRFSIPFVGTVPAIKPACAQSKTKRVSVLATAATVRRDYTFELIREFAGDCRVTLRGAERLAGFAEDALRGIRIDGEAIRAEIEPCFIEDGARTDTVVLACTHYPLILPQLEQYAPWPVTWIDPAPAIARRASQLLGAEGPPVDRTAKTYFTSGNGAPPALARALADFRVIVAEGLPAGLPV
ncbi:MAG: glutamate racemase [Bradyrhizobiaceae bacterium]|nr:glutamate racemase [Bradyrhizobiaceae bacterium]